MDEETTDRAGSSARRGTSGRPNPFAGESAPRGPDPDEEATIVINSPDGSVREYLFTDDVKQAYQTMYERKLDNGPCLWYEMWWEGTELVIEYEGYFRDNSLRPSHENMSSEDMLSALLQGDRQEMDGIPKAHHPALDGRRRSMRDMMNSAPQGQSVNMDVSEYADDLEHLDEGVLPVHNQTHIDIQERADTYPLAVEDMFVKPWSDEDPPSPINSDHDDGEVSEELFEPDFRDYTDGEETVPEGSRGNRYNL